MSRTASQQHTDFERKANHLAVRSRKAIVPTSLGTGEIALGALQQCQFKKDVEQLELVWQGLFRMARGIKDVLSGKAEGAGLV